MILDMLELYSSDRMAYNASNLGITIYKFINNDTHTTFKNTKNKLATELVTQAEENGG